MFKILPAVKAIVNELRGDGVIQEGIDGMDEVQLPAQLLNYFFRPIAPWFPKERQILTFHLREKLFHLTDVLQRWSKTSWTLKQDELCFENLRASFCIQPRLLHDQGILE